MSRLKEGMRTALHEIGVWFVLVTVGLVTGLIVLVGTVWFWGAPLFAVSTMLHLN